MERLSKQVEYEWCSMQPEWEASFLIKISIPLETKKPLVYWRHRDNMKSILYVLFYDNAIATCFEYMLLNLPEDSKLKDSNPLGNAIIH